MDNNHGNKKGPSWAFVIIFIIVFWPVGFLLLFKKLLGDKSAIMRNSKIIRVLGYIMAFCGIVYFIMTFTEEEAINTPSTAATYAVAGLFFLIGGIILIINGKRMKSRGEKYRKYISIIVNGNVTTIENIAVAVPVSYDVAVKDLQKMIEIGYFEGAYIDNGTHEIVLGSNTEKQEVSCTEQNTTSAGEVQVIQCQCCGAKNNIVAGKVSECEYCGSPLK